MNTIQKLAVSAIATATLLGLGACSGMTQQEKGTAVGAGVGAIGGSVLTGGSAAGGAVVGGVIGNQVTKP